MARSQKRNRNQEHPDPISTVTASARRQRSDAASASAGQSGDTQGLSDLEQSTSESVVELVEEGQFFEAAVVSGVEDAPPATAGPVRTRQVREDDVPREYTDHPPDEPNE